MLQSALQPGLLIASERILFNVATGRKYYDADRGLFIHAGPPDVLTGKERVLFKRKRFSSFAKHLENDLSGCDFRGYDFHDVDLSKFDVSDCIIDDAVLKRQGLYDDSFWQTALRNMPSDEYRKSQALAPAVGNVGIDVFEPESANPSDNIVIAYISDLHLDYRVFNKFPEGTTEVRIELFIRELVEQLLRSSPRKVYAYLIGGDVSSSRELCELFYRTLAEMLPSESKIFAVLGNHEYWGFRDCDAAISSYSEFFSKMDILFLHDTLVIENDMIQIVSGDDFLRWSPEKIRDICQPAKLIVLGGTGFSGLCREFNATNGLYRNCIGRDEEIERSEHFASIHRRLMTTVTNPNAIVLTHMPIECWNPDRTSPDWFYVNGHTHQQRRVFDDSLKLLADNQVGYSSSAVSWKSFTMSKLYDVFANYPDGMHRVSIRQYKRFYDGINIFMQWKSQNRYDESQILHMLKKNGTYMFILETAPGKLFLMKGAQRLTLKSEDVSYYYQNMDRYIALLAEALEKYRNSLKSISKSVKSFGGSGKIHGCIVDIDSLSHVFLNPRDGTLTSYYATDKVNKTTYSNIEALLEENCPALHEKFCALLNSGDRTAMALSTVDGRNEKQRYTGTDIYTEYSDLMLNYQYALEKHIIRTWNEDLLTAAAPGLDSAGFGSALMLLMKPEPSQRPCCPTASVEAVR